MALKSKEYFGCTIDKPYKGNDKILYFIKSTQITDPRIKYDFYMADRQKNITYDNKDYVIHDDTYIILKELHVELTKRTRDILDYAKTCKYVQCSLYPMFGIYVGKKFKEVVNGNVKLFNTIYNSAKIRTSIVFDINEYDKCIEYINAVENFATLLYSYEEPYTNLIDAVNSTITGSNTNEN